MLSSSSTSATIPPGGAIRHHPGRRFTRVTRVGHEMSATARVPARFLPQTKFEVPIVRADLVQRPALVTALHPLDITRLVLVGAPAGSGKTTLLAQWARSPGAPAVAWVALDEGDDDPVLFWTCALEALRRLEPGLGARV